MQKINFERETRGQGKGGGQEGREGAFKSQEKRRERKRKKKKRKKEKEKREREKMGEEKKTNFIHLATSRANQFNRASCISNSMPNSIGQHVHASSHPAPPDAQY